MKMMNVGSSPHLSRVFEDNALDNAGDVLAAIGDFFEDLVDLLPLDEAFDVGFIFEETCEAVSSRRSAFIFQAVDLDAVLEDFR